MTLTDTGVLVALLDRRDPSHAKCTVIAGNLPPEPMATTWPCFTEAMYLLGQTGGERYQATLWRMRRLHQLVILDLTETEVNRMAVLMPQYANVPMDLADASLVAIAESRGFRQLFTIDSDFYLYVMLDGSVLEMI